jgi:hypothetical protein
MRTGNSQLLQDVPAGGTPIGHHGSSRTERTLVGVRDTDSKPTYLNVYQEKPSDEAFALWRRAIKLCILQDTGKPARRDRRDLRVATMYQLGNWIGRRVFSHRRHRYYRSPQGRVIIDDLSQEEPTYYAADLIEERMGRRQGGQATIDMINLERIEQMDDGCVPLTASVARYHETQFHGWPAALPHQDDPTAARMLRYEQIPNSFTEYLRNREPWESNLFTKCKRVDGNETDLKNLMESGQEIELLEVSDGGAAAGRASFAWVIKYQERTLWQCKGVAYGTAPSSFRAESYGMLSASGFIHHYEKYFEVNAPGPTIQFKMCCDNQGLIIRLNQRMQWGNAHPNDCLEAEYDLEQQIYHYLQNMDTLKSLKHVKGHQDSETPIHLLSPEARANVEADRLATEQLRSMPRPMKKIPFNPSSQAMLVIDNEYVTSDFKNSIRDAATAQPLWDYIKEKENWTEAMMQKIDWTSNELALRKLEFPQQMFVHKVVWGILPTHQDMERFGQHPTDTCPSCMTQTETIDHLWECPSRAQWRTDFVESMQKKLRSLDTERSMEIVLLRGLRQLLCDHSATLASDRLPAHIEKAVEAQNEIGWKQILKGRFATQWMEIQRRHIQADPALRKDKTKSATTWKKEVCFHLWINLHEGWKLRNKDKHGHDAAEYETKKKQRLQPALRRLYNMKDSLAATDRVLLRGTMEERQASMRADVLEAWIANMTPLITKLAQRAEKNRKDGNKEIYEYMERLPPPAPDPGRIRRTKDCARKVKKKFKQLGLLQSYRRRRQNVTQTQQMTRTYTHNSTERRRG